MDNNVIFFSVHMCIDIFLTLTLRNIVLNVYINMCIGER